MTCEDEIDDWEILAFDNEDDDWCSNFETQQHFFILSINLISTIKIAQKKKKGGFRALGRASESQEINKEEADKEDSEGGADDTNMGEWLDIELPAFSNAFQLLSTTPVNYWNALRAKSTMVIN